MKPLVNEIGTTVRDGKDGAVGDEVDEGQHERRQVAEGVGSRIVEVPGGELAEDDDRPVDDDAESHDGI